MAQIQPDSTDFLKELVGLVPRAELRLPTDSSPVIAGFRKDGCLSLYFGPELFYQLDRSGRLRRALVAQHLFRTQGSTLAELTRVRSAKVSQLVRRELSAAELDQFVKEMQARVAQLTAAVKLPGVIVREIAPDGPILPLLERRLETISGTLAPTINRAR